MFRCHSPESLKEKGMAPPTEPQPQEYGLSNEAVKYFSAFFHRSELVAPLLGWASFIGLTFLFGLDSIAKRQYAWPIMMLYFVPGLVFGMAVNRLREAYFEHSKKRHPLYQNWKSYSRVHSEWCHQNSKTIAEDGARQGSLRKEEAEARRRQLAWWMTLDGRQFEMETAKLLRQL